MGLGAGFFMVNAAPFMHDYSTHETQPWVFGGFAAVNTGMMFLGTVLGGAAADMVARSLSNWTPLSLVTEQTFAQAYSIVLITTGVLASIGIALVLLIRDVRWGRRRESYWSNARELFRHRLTWAQFSFTLIIGLGSGLVVPFFPVFLRVMLNVPASVVGALQGAAMGSVAIGVLTTPWLISRFGRVATVTGSQMISLPFILGIAYGPFLVALGFGPLVAIMFTGIVFIIRNALMNLVNPVNTQLLMDIYGERQRLNIVAINMMAFPLGRALGAQVGGNMMKHISYQSPYWVTLALYAGGIALYYFAYAKLERRFQKRVRAGENISAGML